MSEKSPGGSHAEALKSTSIIGGSTAITMVIRMVRTKVLAVLLGPVGVGLEATFDSIINVARNFSNLGISGSGVRQIAAAVGTGDEEKIASTVVTMRRVCRLLGAVSAVVFFLASKAISVATFGDGGHTRDIQILSLILVFVAINGGQGALLQGMRRIGDFARMNIIGAVAGTVMTIPIVYYWGVKGIPAYMVIAMGNIVVISWLYVRRVKVKPVKVSWGHSLKEARSLMGLGLVLTASGGMTTLAMYLLNVLVTRYEGVAGVGQFQAANKLSVIYVNFILQAMQTDFFPRLSAVSHDNAKATQMVNDQMEVSVLLALPGILGTLAFAPWAIPIFYSSKFDVASEILCWQMAGMLLRVLCWPMGTVLVAQGLGRLFLATEIAGQVSFMAMTWLGLEFFHLPGTGMAFLASYVVYAVMIYLVLRRVIGFRWSPINIQLTRYGGVTVATALVAHLLLPAVWAMLIGAVLAVVMGVYCLKLLAGLVGVEKIEGKLRKFGVRIPLEKWLGNRTK